MKMVITDNLCTNELGRGDGKVEEEEGREEREGGGGGGGGGGEGGGKRVGLTVLLWSLPES